jgi:hypothetical protein
MPTDNLVVATAVGAVVGFAGTAVGVTHADKIIDTTANNIKTLLILRDISSLL